jgi:hypothetical protein
MPINEVPCAEGNSGLWTLWSGAAQRAGEGLKGRHYFSGGARCNNLAAEEEAAFVACHIISFSTVKSVTLLQTNRERERARAAEKMLHYSARAV